VGDQSSAKASTYTGQHNTERRRHTSVPRAGFEPAIPMFEWPKTVLDLDRAAIEPGKTQIELINILKTDSFMCDVKCRAPYHVQTAFHFSFQCGECFCETENYFL
jgi:hypothetical protein